VVIQGPSRALARVLGVDGKKIELHSTFLPVHANTRPRAAAGPFSWISTAQPILTLESESESALNLASTPGAIPLLPTILRALLKVLSQTHLGSTP
jgi:ABC-type enterobactin transport system permease subunit